MTERPLASVFALALLTGCAPDFDASLGESQAELLSGGGICAVPDPYIDGCTTAGIELVHPRVAVFRDVFQDQCIRHDRCYGTLGASPLECDEAFFAEMKDACNGRFNKYLRPVEWHECRIAAEEFKLGVQAYEYVEGLSGFVSYQRAAVDRSKALAGRVNREECGMTPEQSGLYHPRLLEAVKSIFVATTGHAPTAFQFFQSIHASDDFAHPDVWSAAVARYAAAYAAPVPPVAGTARTFTGDALILDATTPDMPDLVFRWRSNYGVSTERRMTLRLPDPTYDRTTQVKGFLVVESRGHRDLALFDERVVQRGECASRRGLPCR